MDNLGTIDVMLFVFLNTENVSNICSWTRVHGNDNSKIRETLAISSN